MGDITPATANLGSDQSSELAAPEPSALKSLASSETRTIRSFSLTNTHVEKVIVNNIVRLGLGLGLRGKFLIDDLGSELVRVRVRLRLRTEDRERSGVKLALTVGLTFRR